MTKNALLEASEKLFLENGYNRTSLAKICEVGGVSKGAVYHHYRDKEALLEAVVRRLFYKLRLIVNDEARSCESSPAERVVVASRAYLIAIQNPPRLLDFLFLEAPAAIGWSRWRDIDSEFFRAELEQALSLALIDIESNIPPFALASAITAMVTDAALDISSSDEPERGRAEFEHALRALLRGLGLSLAPDGATPLGRRSEGIDE